MTGKLAGSSVVASTPWNLRLRELANKSLFAESISLYRSMLRSGSSPDAFSFPFTLKSCAALSLPVSGKQLHCHVVRGGCEAEPFVLTSLIPMYCKCCLVEDARKVFDENPESRQLGVCYNALISGYTVNSKVYDAVYMFRRMKEFGVSVDSVTMLGLVPVCTVPDYLWFGMSLHGQCVRGGTDSEISVLNSFITMYMKCGSVGSSRKLFDEMPVKGLITWNAVKEPGYSYVEHKGRVHLFLVGDRSHEQTEEVYRMLDELETSVMEIAGNTENDRDQEVLNSRREHSERLAVAFGILNTSPGAEILVIKNLRVCKDCHVFIKMVSKIVDRRFVIRDASRFHYFKDGVCSCKDY